VLLLFERVQRVEAFVAKILERIAVKSIRAALCDDLDHPADCEPKFGRRSDGIHLEFLHGALWIVLARLALFGPCVRHAVHEERIRVKGGACGNRHVVVEGARSVLTRARHQEREVQILA
jgi:hypothetical protein